MDAKLYDGVTALAHDVRVEFDECGLTLSQPGGWSDSVAGDLLKRIDSVPSELRLGRTDAPGWRLIMPAAAAADTNRLLGREQRYGRWIDRLGLVPALLIGAAISAAVVGIGYTAPQWLAPHIPASWERNVGTAIVGDFGNLKCRDPSGQRALEAMVERVAPGSTEGEAGIKVAALNVPVFNAAALPGGYIVIFKPAITEAEPEALAGIVAHEVAHIRRRHVTEALIRELGIGALIRLFAGDFGANAQQIVALSYTREDEAEADGDAIQMLKHAGISPKPTADLFHDLAEQEEIGLPTSAEFLQSHPLSASRADRFARSLDPRSRYTPALSQEQADALFDICSAK